MDAAFRAISDPSRRQILDLLALGQRSAGELLEHFSFSQPALSKHLRVLREAGLVEAEAAGRRRVYALRGERLRSVSDWVSHYERFWSEKLDALGGVLDDEAACSAPREEPGR